MVETPNRVKHPRTPHLPWSPGATNDDRMLSDVSCFQGKRVIVTLKMDGENTTIYPDGYSHARSTDASPHPSRTRVRALAAEVGRDIPEGWRICGENVYAVHSIRYNDLPDFFLVHSIWEGDTCLSWGEVEYWSDLLELTTVPVIWYGPMPSEEELTKIFSPYADAHEGYVVRVEDEFDAADFGSSVAKWVRPHHVQTDQHWMAGEMETNSLAPSEADLED